MKRTVNVRVMLLCLCAVLVGARAGRAVTLFTDEQWVDCHTSSGFQSGEFYGFDTDLGQLLAAHLEWHSIVSAGTIGVYNPTDQVAWGAGTLHNDISFSLPGLSHEMQATAPFTWIADRHSWGFADGGATAEEEGSTIISGPILAEYVGASTVLPLVVADGYSATVEDPYIAQVSPLSTRGAWFGLQYEYASPEPVPDPGTLLLGITGLAVAGAGLRLRRRRR